MKALVKMEVTLYDKKGNIVAHDNSERVYETTQSDYLHYGHFNKHTEELRFAWTALVENDIY